MTNSFDRLRASMSGGAPAPKSGGVVPDFFDALDSPEFRAGDIQQVRVTLLHVFGEKEEAKAKLLVCLAGNLTESIDQRKECRNYLEAT